MKPQRTTRPIRVRKTIPKFTMKKPTTPPPEHTMRTKDGTKFWHEGQEYVVNYGKTTCLGSKTEQLHFAKACDLAIRKKMQERFGQNGHKLIVKRIIK